MKAPRVGKQHRRQSALIANHPWLWSSPGQIRCWSDRLPSRQPRLAGSLPISLFSFDVLLSELHNNLSSAVVNSRSAHDSFETLLRSVLGSLANGPLVGGGQSELFLRLFRNGGVGEASVGWCKVMRTHQACRARPVSDTASAFADGSRGPMRAGSRYVGRTERVFHARYAGVRRLERSFTAISTVNLLPAQAGHCNITA